MPYLHQMGSWITLEEGDTCCTALSVDQELECLKNIQGDGGSWRLAASTDNSCSNRFNSVSGIRT